MTNRLLSIIGVGLIVLYDLSAQTLFIPDGATLYIGRTDTVTSVTVNGDLLNNGTIENNGKIAALGNVQNDSVFSNTGVIVLYADWTNNANYNGISGQFRFKGGRIQRIFNNDLVIGSLIVDSGDTVILDGQTAEVIDTIDFRNGVLKTTAFNQLTVDNGARVLADDFGNSYFEGRLVLQGGHEMTGDEDTPFKFFPLGSNGRFAPITFSTVDDSEFYELAVTLIIPNSPNPDPDSTLIGVSDQSVWLIEVADPGIDSALVEVDFINENLTDFGPNQNDINADIKSPVVAQSDAIGGSFTSLGGDSILFESIISEQKLYLGDGANKYIAVALAPVAPERVDVFIPQAFSPVAMDLVNRTLRVFATKVRENDFRMVVFNRFNNIVYETNSFQEANTTGWDGRLKNGNDAPPGLYFCVVSLVRENGTEEIAKGPVYLVR